MNDRLEAYLFLLTLLSTFAGAGLIGNYIGNKAFFPEEVRSWNLYLGLSLIAAGLIGLVEFMIA